MNKPFGIIRDFFSAVRQDWARRSVERQLYKLGDRMLSDIGLNYDQVPGAARQAVGMSPDSPTISQLFKQMAQGLLQPFLGWHRRNRVLGELSSLDDRMLADIGLSRHELRELVRDMDAMAARTLATYPAAMKDYQSLPLALWGKARIVQDGMHVQQAMNANESAHHIRVA